jgi:hypothetical protein
MADLINNVRRWYRILIALTENGIKLRVDSKLSLCAVPTIIANQVREEFACEFGICEQRKYL